MMAIDLSAKGLIALTLCLILVPSGMAEHYTVQIGSKSNPNAHLFSYDEKFRESTYAHNYMINMSASKEFTDATRLSTSMNLFMNPNLTEMDIRADFIGTARIGYLVLDPESGLVKEEMSRIDHLLVGNFSLDEHIRVAKDNSMEGCFLGLNCV